ncbi:MAG: gluconokinase [Pyrinomonadaceae bacterium]
MILGLDIGTSSVRAALYDKAGNVLPRTMVKNERTLTATDDGGAEIDADEAFDQIVVLIDDVLKKSEKVKGDITHVASSSFWHSIVGVDANGNSMTKVFGWADTRSRDQVGVLRKKFNETDVHNRTGARFHSSYWAAKLLWLRSERIDEWNKTAQWISLSDYLVLKLFGNAVTSISMASGTGIFDIRKCVWDRELLKFLKIEPDKLPQISDAISMLDSKYAKRWPRLKSARWFPAIGDGTASNIGSGCVQKNKAALMIGTSGAMRVAYKGSPPKTIPKGLWCYRIDRKTVIVGGALSDGGGLYAWLKNNLHIDRSDAAVGKEMANRGADSHGLTVMPFFAGERSTGYNETAKGAILGLTMSHDAIDVLQAAMESVAFRFAEIFDQIKSVTQVDEIVVSGGAIDASPVWTQMIADVFGRDLCVLDKHEASMRGAVLLALESIGKIESIDSVPISKIKIEFHPKCHEIYKNAQKRHEKAYKLLMS